MKKIVIFAIAATLCMSILAGCGSKAMCDFCGEEKVCTTKSVFGEELKVCKDCMNELSGLAG